MLFNLSSKILLSDSYIVISLVILSFNVINAQEVNSKVMLQNNTLSVKTAQEVTYAYWVINVLIDGIWTVEYQSPPFTFIPPAQFLDSHVVSQNPIKVYVTSINVEGEVFFDVHDLNNSIGDFNYLNSK